MKRTASLLVAGGLMAGIFGCNAAKDDGPAAAAGESATAAEVMFVSLKVPNMV